MMAWAPTGYNMTVSQSRGQPRQVPLTAPWILSGILLWLAYENAVWAKQDRGNVEVSCLCLCYVAE